MKTLTWSAVVAAAFLATIPLAQAGGAGFGGGRGDGPMGGGPARLIERFDTNKDGKITKEEIDAVQVERFKGAAGDGNAAMSLTEFETLYNAEHRERMVRAFQRLDRDGDGQVTKEEFDRMSSMMLTRMDRNGDGALSPEDRPERGERHGERHGERGGWGGWWRGHGHGEGRGPMMGPDGGDDDAE